MAKNQSERATHLLSAADNILRSIGSRLDQIDQADYDRLVTIVRSQVSDARFEADWSAGYLLSLDQAVAEALSGDDCEFVPQTGEADSQS